MPPPPTLVLPLIPLEVKPLGAAPCDAPEEDVAGAPPSAPAVAVGVVVATPVVSPPFAVAFVLLVAAPDATPPTAPAAVAAFAMGALLCSEVFLLTSFDDEGADEDEATAFFTLAAHELLLGSCCSSPC